MDETNKEVVCVKCNFYTDKFFSHKHKDGKFYCSQCYSKELKKLK